MHSAACTSRHSATAVALLDETSGINTCRQPLRSMPSRQGDPVAISYPYASPGSMQPMAWQMDDDYTFSTSGRLRARMRRANGGSVTTPSMSPPGPSEISSFRISPLASLGRRGIPLLRAPFAGELRSWCPSLGRPYPDIDVRLVIVDRSEPGSGPVMKLFERSPRRSPSFSSGQFSLWLRRSQ